MNDQMNNKQIKNFSYEAPAHLIHEKIVHETYNRNKEEIFRETLDPNIILNSLGAINELMKAEFPKNFDSVILEIKKVVDDNFELYSLIFIDLIE